MAEGWINLFVNAQNAGNKPHYSGYLKIDGVDHEFALWPAKEGKKGFTGKYKPRQTKQSKPEKSATDEAYDKIAKALDTEIPF